MLAMFRKRQSQGLKRGETPADIAERANDYGDAAPARVAPEDAAPPPPATNSPMRPDSPRKSLSSPDLANGEARLNHLEPQSMGHGFGNGLDETSVSTRSQGTCS